MIRKAFKMRVYRDQVEEYTKRHDMIWPELEEVLKNHGVHNYSIFFDSETHSLIWLCRNRIRRKMEDDCRNRDL